MLRVCVCELLLQIPGPNMGRSPAWSYHTRLEVPPGCTDPSFVGIEQLAFERNFEPIPDLCEGICNGDA